MFTSWVEVTSEITRLMMSPTISGNIALCNIVKICCTGHTLNSATSDSGQCHVIAFRPISVAARSWSYDKLKYHLVTAAPSFTVKTIDWVHHTGPSKRA